MLDPRLFLDFIIITRRNLTGNPKSEKVYWIIYVPTDPNAMMERTIIGYYCFLVWGVPKLYRNEI